MENFSKIIKKEFGLQLEKISKEIKKRYAYEKEIGVLMGVSGLALFQFHYSKYLDDNAHSELGAEMISLCIERINQGYSYPTFCSGIAGMAWAIQYLQDEGFIDLDCDSLLGEFDEFLFNQMKTDLTKGNFDFLHGALGYGVYFLRRFQCTFNQNFKLRYEFYLKWLLDGIEELAIKDGDGYKWESSLDFEKGNLVYNLGLSHGMSSILNFVSRLHSVDSLKEKAEKLAKGCSAYILRFQRKDSKQNSQFPNVIQVEKPNAYNSRIAWCYGDLGIGLSLLQSGKYIGDTTIVNRALEILDHTTTRKSAINSQVVDAGICHGSFGNALIYSRMFQITNKALFRETSDFWLKDGIKKGEHKFGYDFYKQWYGYDKNWIPPISLLDGVSGIGLVMLDCLSKTSNNWAECLLID